MSDNISRKAALDAVSYETFECYEARKAIRALPSADRNGHWEIYVISPFDGEGCRCSECGTEGAPYWGYCPKCGADMRGSSMRMIRDLTEMNKLEDYLKANGFEYQREDEDAEPMDKHQIIVFENGVRSWDVICHYGSYGGDEGLLEGMGDLFGPDVDGYLTAEDVIKKIEEVRS